MSDVAKTLLDARALVAAGWTRDAWARDANGSPVNALSNKAVCFCSVGAIRRASGGEVELQTPAVAAFISVVNSPTIARFNDRSTHEEVLAAFDRAIASCEATAP